MRILRVIPEFAVEVGLNNSIVLSQFDYWIKHNEGKEQYYFDGHYWTYGSYLFWHEQFPFWSIRTIARIFRQLESDELILIGNYNKNNYDKTKWYTIQYENKSIAQFLSASAVKDPAPYGQIVAMDLDDLSTIQLESIQRVKTRNGTNTKSNSEIFDPCIDEFIKYYYNLYAICKGYPHPHLKQDQVQRISRCLQDFVSEHCLDGEDLEAMAITFFESNIQSDHNLNHFATYGILENRYYETGLH